MPRNNTSGASLRNRNRITNKSRLRIHLGNFDSDLAINEEEEDRHRITHQTAGVDAEETNEHHLQQVLSHQSNRKATPNRDTKKPLPQAYIPTPEAQGVADEWQALYPSDVWRDPASYTCSSKTADEAVRNGIAGDFTYYMDERDKDWLDKNNEEARGEGTSASGSLSPNGTRASSRSVKAKGKDPEVFHPVVISEDDFELVMGIFEKATFDKAEFLHHSFEEDTIPAFADYQDIFANDLPATMFACFVKPPSLPKPQVLLRFAQIIYPHWKDRRVERQGHRIIPIVNFDESDTRNESYICFRRREIKSVRKTRASQVSSSDKLARLGNEMTYPLKLVDLVLQREKAKQDLSKASQSIWTKRRDLANLKMKFPSLHDAVDEGLLIEKERPPRKTDHTRTGGLRLKATRDDLTGQMRLEANEKPKDRLAKINAKVDNACAAHRERNAQWDDSENLYQARSAPHASRLFRFFLPPEGPNSHSVAARTRRGRGGRFLVDRRPSGPRSILDKQPRSTLFDLTSQSASDADERAPEQASETDRDNRARARWRFDSDDDPVVPPAGVDEQDRILVDEYDAPYMRFSMSLIGDSDQSLLSTDPHFYSVNTEGRNMATVTYRTTVPPGPAYTRRDAQLRYQQSQVQISQAGQASGAGMGSPLKQSMLPANMTPMKMGPGGVRSISTYAQQSSQQLSGAAGSGTGDTRQTSPPNGTAVNGTLQPSPSASTQSTSLVNQTRPPNNVSADHPPSVSNGANGSPAVNGTAHASSPPRPVPPSSAHSSQPAASSQPVATNGIPQYNARPTGLSQAQVQNLKSALATAPNQDSTPRSLPAGFMQVLPAGFQMTATQSGMAMKLAQAGMWPLAQGVPTTNGTVNGAEATGGLRPRTPAQPGRRATPTALHGIPARPQTPSTSPIPAHTQSPSRAGSAPSIQPQPHQSQNGI